MEKTLKRNRQQESLSDKILRWRGAVLLVLVPLLLISFVLFLMPARSHSDSIYRKFSPNFTSKRYAVIFDAGSSGSRVHVFCFNQQLDLVPMGQDLELFIQRKPGLSGYATDPEAAANSLSHLLEKAEAAVPEELRYSTPVRVGATAGLRQLEGDTSDRILQAATTLGTNVGDIGLWEVGSRERLVQRNFKVWDVGACILPLQAGLAKDPGVSVNCVIWSPDGSLFGVAYLKHLVQIYSYHGNDDIRQHLEIDAHVGGVNDLAFSHPNKQLSVITCGDDKLIKVWDAATGTKQYTFEGHEAPVYSVCPHHKENIQFIFSTALDGKIKAWLYDNLGSRVDYDAPGRWCTTMPYSADGTRLFSCGTSKDGESHIVEWNESEGAVKRAYQGFRKRSLGVAG